MNKKIKNLYITSFIMIFLGIIGTMKQNILILFLLVAIILLPIAIILMIIEAIKNKTPIYTPANINMPAPVKTTTPKDNTITYSAYFVKNNMHKPRKKDGNIIKGDCILKIDSKNDTFTIIQGEETIINNISSIYYFDIWHFKGEIYYKFSMRSKNEYTFKDIKGEIEEIKDELDYLNIKIEGKI